MVALSQTCAKLLHSPHGFLNLAPQRVNPGRMGPCRWRQMHSQLLDTTPQAGGRLHDENHLFGCTSRCLPQRGQLKGSVTASWVCCSRPTGSTRFHHHNQHSPRPMLTPPISLFRSLLKPSDYACKGLKLVCRHIGKAGPIEEPFDLSDALDSRKLRLRPDPLAGLVPPSPTN